MMDIQAPVSILWVVRQLLKGGMRVVIGRRLTTAMALSDV